MRGHAVWGAGASAVLECWCPRECIFVSLTAGCRTHAVWDADEALLWGAVWGAVWGAGDGTGAFECLAQTTVKLEGTLPQMHRQYLRGPVLLFATYSSSCVHPPRT